MLETELLEAIRLRNRFFRNSIPFSSSLPIYIGSTIAQRLERFVMLL